MAWQSQKELDVWRACDQLYVENNQDVAKITIAAIRARCKALTQKGGNTGGISRYKKSWIAARGIPTRTAETASTMPDMATTAVELLRKEIEQKVNAAYEQQLQTVLKQRDELAEENATLEEELSELKAYCAELEAQKAEAECHAEEQEKKYREAQACLTLQTALLEKRESQWQVERQEKQEMQTTQLALFSEELAAQRQQNHQTMQIWHDNQDQQHREWIKEKDDLKTQLHKLAQQLKISQDSEVALKTELKHRLQQHAAMKKNSQKLQKELEKKLSSLAALKAEQQAQRQRAQTTTSPASRVTLSRLAQAISALDRKLAKFLKQINTRSNHHDHESD